MAKLSATRSVQYPVFAELAFNFNNWVTDSVDLVAKTLGATVAGSTDPLAAGLTGPVANTITFDLIPLPAGAVITGGELIVETAYLGPTAATITLGIAGTLTGLLASTSLLAVARTPLLLTSPLTCNAGQNLRATIAYTVANATVGKARVRIQYTLDGKANEVVVA